MKRSVVSAKPFVVLVAICLVAILAAGAEAGRDVPSVSNHEVNEGQSFTTTTTPTNLPPAQVRSLYMAYAPEGAFENSQFIFDPHFGFHPRWFWGFHGFPFHHFGGMQGVKAQGGSMDVPVGKYKGGEVPEVGGKVAGNTP